MTSRTLLFAFLALMAGSVSISCSEDIPDCPSKMCVLAGTWQLVEVYVDDAKETGELSNYRLSLTMADPNATVSEFSRIQPSGSADQGMWSVENNEKILRLIPNDDPSLTEDWIIEKFTPRELVLIINRDTGIKDGPSKIEFFLAPI
jgi:hypothetical protein